MITNQLTKFLQARICKTINNTDVASNFTYGIQYLFYEYNYTYKAYTNTSKWIDVGIGDTEESPDDYKLAQPNYSGNYLVCDEQTNIAKNDLDIFAGKAVFSNTGNTDVVVKEIGLCSGSLNSRHQSVNDCVLVFRSVLQSPVTIKPGEAYTFELHVTLEAKK